VRQKRTGVCVVKGAGGDGGAEHTVERGKVPLGAEERFEASHGAGLSLRALAQFPPHHRQGVDGDARKELIPVREASGDAF